MAMIDLPKGLMISAPASGTGKTTVMLGLLRALRDDGLTVQPFKSGPDYIDPAFHSAACGAACLNLDAWAMAPDQIAAYAAGPGLLLIEGAMGLFDGAPPDGRGSVADLARRLGLPVILVVDASHMAQSVAPLVAGFAGHDPEVRIAGVILNRVGSPRHAALLRRALAPLGLPVLGAVPRRAGLSHPSRHLGLVQADEHPELEAYLSSVADTIAQAVDLEVLVNLAAPVPMARRSAPLPPAQRIAVARDAAFSFVYAHHLADWRAAGAELSFFSPLADEAVPAADLVFLPGGYPELHAGRIAAAETFMSSLKLTSQVTDIYGECGGYMALGEGLIDADGTRHAMAGLLRLETSYAARKLHLGYRSLHGIAGPFPGDQAGHEFHYATTLRAEGAPLFTATDAEGTALAPMGLRQGRVTGSFAHVIAART